MFGAAVAPCLGDGRDNLRGPGGMARRSLCFLSATGVPSCPPYESSLRDRISGSAIRMSERIMPALFKMYPYC